uniref:Signal recognition particle 19 kDa protein n=1 Tax=Coccolithus braarudii TaxID=221442 RepID=A0A7S0LUE8_9EUKA|mmetsp:Transcript_6264/g.13656  ORF Transcript_6264/g.13656 Transcript_6264/m.13656 type:complete len:174 (+) Transcript_6264:40-561(+)|eukprot:CAMPEP_0183359754 /NCGR_PEP_ID=MMETSP0164_2-20130417/53171_1 /TAXON_ID=221442 /ORGANISM="Coccolithus pelagicus ssp braarudi, Strain PLY182g" /LENGTH=173 /DNA_ID=CAMNT_0025533941 /DNA_START=28 /DNA_END=549 /DNA_ORIENTATION=+
MSDAVAASSSRAFDEHHHDRRVIIYPIYINSKAKITDGRRIATSHCVENPTLQEILDVLEVLGLECELEDKRYPRDALQRGRIRVLLKDLTTGEPSLPNITTRKALLMEIGAMIPNLKSRKEPKPKQPVAAAALPQPGVASPIGSPVPPPAYSPSGGATKGSTSNKKKGGKKK